LIKKFPSVWKKLSENRAGGDFFDSHCRLRSEAIYPRPATRTKRFTSSVHYFLLNYQ